MAGGQLLTALASAERIPGALATRQLSELVRPLCALERLEAWLQLEQAGQLFTSCRSMLKMENGRILTQAVT